MIFLTSEIADVDDGEITGSGVSVVGDCKYKCQMQGYVGKKAYCTRPPRSIDID